MGVIVRAISAAAVLVGATVLICWALDIAILTRATLEELAGYAHRRYAGELFHEEAKGER